MIKASGRSLNAAGIPAANRRSRKGFVLVEVIVAMVLLAVAVSSLAALVYSVSRSGLAATGSAYRNGVLMQEVNRLETIPYDSMAVGSMSTTVTAQPYPHTRIVTVTEPVANVKTVKVVVTPANSAFKPDTVTFTRTRARTSKVLCTDCPQG
ncbi:MAG TPA: prepilin-type N-terminal cleavage/methylation domain-containing protein [Gemmatimonadaceae bacterium]|nr:prepilin-type N-terminal cleavage/methylation domain-containing protein [Gemmatimonadaceae bacterium]